MPERSSVPLARDLDEPRDGHGRWTDDIGSDFILDDPPDEGSAGSGGRNPVPTSAGGSGPPVPRAWERYPNADFRNRLAIAEQSAGHKNFGYGEVDNSNDPERVALGRYQMTPVGLKAAGMIDSAGRWTGKYGIRSRAEFLADPDAQEQALTNYVNDNMRLLRANGALAHIGETIDGLKARFFCESSRHYRHCAS